MRISRRSLLASPLAISAFGGPSLAADVATEDWTALAQDVRREMAWAWRNYVELAFGHDQIKPVSGGAESFCCRTVPL